MEIIDFTLARRDILSTRARAAGEARSARIFDGIPDLITSSQEAHAATLHLIMMSMHQWFALCNPYYGRISSSQRTVGR